MNTKLTDTQKEHLPALEQELRQHVRNAEGNKAEKVTTQIQKLFEEDRTHVRLLRAKLWCFQAFLDANSLNYAETGIIGVRSRTPKTSRLYLEATALLAVCYLRKKQLPEAKKAIKDGMKFLTNIQSNDKRQQFQKRFIQRIEEECILSGLIGVPGTLDIDEIQKSAEGLVQSNEDKLFEFLGKNVPTEGICNFRDIREYSILQLPAPDQKLLPPPQTAQRPEELGRKAWSMIGRIAWKALCDPQSQVYQLWSGKASEVYQKAYFATSIVAALKQWQIGASLFASAVVALAMRNSAQQFCEWAKPEGLMIDPTETD